MGKGKTARGVHLHLKGVHRVRRKLADGSTRTHYYAWRGGPKLDPDNLAASYERALRARDAAFNAYQGTTFAANVVKFRKTVKQGSPRYARECRLLQDLLVEEFGDDDIRAFEDERMIDDILEFRDQFEGTPRKADKIVGELSRILNWAQKRGRIRGHICGAIDRIHSADRSDIVWTEGEINAVCAHLSPECARIMRFAAHTALDLPDILTLTWRNIGAEKIAKQRGKTKILATPPITQGARDVLAETPQRSPIVFLNTSGKPYTPSGYRANFNKAKKKTGIDNLRFKDLRGTAATRFKILYGADFNLADAMGWSRSTERQMEGVYISNAAIIEDLSGHPENKNVNGLLKPVNGDQVVKRGET